MTPPLPGPARRADRMARRPWALAERNKEAPPPGDHPFRADGQALGQCSAVDGSGAGSAASMAARVRTLLEIGRAEQALGVVRQGMAEFPQNVDLHLLLASALLACDRPIDAHHAALRAVGIDPTLPQVHVMMAEVLIAEQDYRQALLALHHAAGLDPDDPHARLLTVECLLHIGEEEQAGRRARELAAEHPDDSGSHLCLAQVELDRVRTLQLARPGPACLLLIIGSLVATWGLSLVVILAVWLFVHLRNRGPLRRAERHLRDALQLNPQDPYTLAAVADVMAMRGRRLAAIDASVGAARPPVGVVDSDALRRRVRSGQLVTDAVAVLVPALATSVATGFSVTAGWWTLGISVPLAALPAIGRRRRLRRILPPSMWRSTVGGVAARWTGPVLGGLVVAGLVAGLATA